MNDSRDLKAIAEACQQHQTLRFMRSHGSLYIRNDNGIVFDVHQNRSFPEFMAQNKDYADLVLAANPAAVLALIAENESAHKHWENESNNVQALTAEVVRLTTQVRLAGVSAEMTVHQEVGRAITETLAFKIERDQLKAENERLCNENADALAVNRTIRQQLDCYVKSAERYLFLRNGPDCLDFTDVESMEEVDALIDAAMSNGGHVSQSD